MNDHPFCSFEKVFWLENWPHEMLMVFLQKCMKSDFYWRKPILTF